jgi:hypothetical protein
VHLYNSQAERYQARCFQAVASRFRSLALPRMPVLNTLLHLFHRSFTSAKSGSDTPEIAKCIVGSPQIAKCSTGNPQTRSAAQGSPQ